MRICNIPLMKCIWLMRSCVRRRDEYWLSPRSTMMLIEDTKLGSRGELNSRKR